MSGTSGSSTDARRAGWHDDPTGRYQLRYHNGADWTADVSNDGSRFVDPLGAAPTASPEGASGRATASMVLGIVAVAVGWIPYVAIGGGICAVLAIVLGVGAARRASRAGVETNRARVGITTGAIGLVVVAVGIAFTVVVARALDRYANPQPNETEITSCATDGDAATASGELVNLGSTTADFTVRIDFVRAGTDNAHRTGTVELRDVGAGAMASFELTVALSLDDVDCRIADVDGPRPFGLDLPR